jgi:hypothetical protein
MLLRNGPKGNQVMTSLIDLLSRGGKHICISHLHASPKNFSDKIT